ncbi:hypothetical protein GCM10022245_40380 [Streptomyces mayteni]
MGTTTYRHVAEAVDALTALAPDLTTAVKTAQNKASVNLDGTLLPIDRIAADRPIYPGKHKKHGMYVRVIADPHGRLLWGLARLARRRPRHQGSPHTRPARRVRRRGHALLGRQRPPRGSRNRPSAPSAAGGTVCPQDSRPSTELTHGSERWASRPWRP